MVVLAAAPGCALPHTSHLPALQQGQPRDGKEVGTAHSPQNQPHLLIPEMFKTLLGAVQLELSVPKTKTPQGLPGAEEDKGVILPSSRKH